MEAPTHRVDVAGWSLAVSAFPARGRPRGVVVAGHAMMCNRRTLDRPRGQGLASALAEAGLHVYTFDVRGHGDSAPTTATDARWGYDEIVEEDIPAMVRWAHERHPDLRLAVLGHSLVAHAALLRLGVAPALPVDALVLYAANLWLPRLDPSLRRRLLKRLVLGLWWLSSRPFGYFPARRLRLGSEDVSAAMVDDFCRWTRTNQCLRRSDGADYLAGRARVRQPVLAFVGEEDRLLCAPACAERFLAPVPRHTLERVPGADHMSLVTREDARPIWDQTAEWLVNELDQTGRA